RKNIDHKRVSIKNHDMQGYRYILDRFEIKDGCQEIKQSAKQEHDKQLLFFESEANFFSFYKNISP
ncbi:MAG: hypothetical protein Q7U40_03230, partial [Desulfatirhabdiaceae bacterium]|nr:hypothetical protein [Desulfatirhabdiaceae bacterium]